MFMVRSWLEGLFKRHRLVVGEEAWMGLEAPVVPTEEAEQLAGAHEPAWLGGQASRESLVLASLVYSAKESFDKPRFPLTNRSLDFTDVDVALDFEQLAFEARLSGKVLDADAFLPVCRDHVLVSKRFASTGIAVPARTLAVATA